MASDEKNPDPKEEEVVKEENHPPPAAAAGESQSQFASAETINEEEPEGKKKPEPKPEELEEEASEEKTVEAAEAVTPRERPTRERKAVDRYWIASPVSRSSASKHLSIQKGNGTLLKEIPNVAFKLSKRKPDDNLQILHTILYGKKAKVHSLKKDIGQFSGFVWADNEEKQRAKTKEKIDKCVKEKLLDFCDVLNIPVNKSCVKKEDLTVMLLEFLEAPHATTEELLADMDQKGKSKKRKATSTKIRNSKGASAEKSAKITQFGKKLKQTSKSEDDNEINENDKEQENKSESEEENEDVHNYESEKEDTDSEEKEETKKEVTPKKSSKDNSGAKSGKKSTSTDEHYPEKPAKPQKKTPVTSKKSANADTSVSSSKTKTSTSKKLKLEEEAKKKKEVPVEKSTSKKEGKGKKTKQTKVEPSNEELRAQAVNILKDVDFNTATLSDILHLLGSHFNVDLMHRKVEVKAIITDVIENMSNPDDDDDEDSDEEAEDSGKE